MAKGRKTGGRTKGTVNKASVPLAERAAALGIDPFDVLLFFAAGDWQKLGYDAEQVPSSYSEHGTVHKYTIDPGVRAKAAGEACNFLYPKLKAIEHSGDTNSFQSFAQMVAGLVKEQNASQQDAESEARPSSEDDSSKP